MYGYIIFTDIEKYSTLKDADLKIFFNKIIPIISEELKEYKDAAIIWNTWGDAIFAIYDKAEMAINMALAYRESFSKIDFEKFGIKKLNPRIAGNFGEFEMIFDHVSGKQNVHGTLVNLTARIEPVTTPGEIFVTKEFRDMSISSYDKLDNIRFEDMGEIKLPKNAGILNLFRMCKKVEIPMRPAGTIISNIDYKVQLPVDKNAKVDNKPPAKSIEQRLSTNTNKKISSEEKLNKIAIALKEDTSIKEKETTFTKDLIQSFEKLRKKTFKEIIKENPFLIAIFIFIIAMLTNFIIDTVYAQLKLNIPLSADIIAVITNWIWLKGFLIGAFLVGYVMTLIQKKLIKIKSIILTPFLIVLLHLSLYILPNKTVPLNSFLMQNLYIYLILLWLVCFAGFSKGAEVANDKIKASVRK